MGAAEEEQFCLRPLTFVSLVGWQVTVGTPPFSMPPSPLGSFTKGEWGDEGGGEWGDEAVGSEAIAWFIWAGEGSLLWASGGSGCHGFSVRVSDFL